MKFVDPLILLAIVPALIVGITIHVAACRRRRRMLGMILGDRADDPGATTLAKGRRQGKFALVMAAVVLLIVAAARPYVRSSSLPVSGKGRDVLVLFDVSKSMRSTDLPPSRMEQAKYLLREIFTAFPRDRFGIIPFAGTAFLSCPLTADHSALMTATEDLDPSSVPVGGTDLDKALRTAMRAFDGAGGDHRALLLLTDGDQLSGDAGRTAAELGKMHLPLIAVGFGSPDAAAPVPGDDGKIMHSASGEVAGSRLNEELLRQLASSSGGIYVRSTVGDTGFAAVREFIAGLGAGEYEKQTHFVPEHLFPWFIGAAFILLFFAGSLSERRKRIGGTAALFAAAALLLTGAAEPEKTAPPPPADPAALYRQALDLQKKGDADAEKLYEAVISGGETPEYLRGRSLQNLGVLAHRSGREALIGGEQALAAQSPDGAEKELAKALKEFERGAELYARSMHFGDRAETAPGRAGNLQQLILDRKKAEELKKKIEELKKQRQRAAENIRNAQQRNRQEEKKQQQKQQQGEQEKKQQQSGQQGEQEKKQQQQTGQQGKPQQEQQNQQAGQQGKEAAEQAVKQAADDARKLEEQAKELGQKELEKRAKDAAGKLDEAAGEQQRGNYREAAEKLDEAAKELPPPENERADGQKKEDGKDAGKDPGKEEKGEAGKAGEKPRDEKSAGHAEAAAAKADEAKNDAQRKLDLLDDEAGKLRDAIRRTRNMRRRPVEKDW